MIRVHRLAAPPILVEQGELWTRELCQARQEYYRQLVEHEHGRRAKQPRKPRAIKRRYAHRQIRDELSKMFGPKCAYCESSVLAVSYQHVEHFRPQSVYPRLAYDWSNLLLACQRCNSTHKGDRFPLLDGTAAVEDAADPCSQLGNDASALVDPCREDPAVHFTFQDAVLICLSPRAEQTRDLCGLNREDLKDEREHWLIRVVLTAKLYQLAIQGGRRAEEQEFRGRLQELLTPKMPYVAMTRAKLRDLGIDVGTL